MNVPSYKIKRNYSSLASSLFFELTSYDPPFFLKNQDLCIDSSDVNS